MGRAVSGPPGGSVVVDEKELDSFLNIVYRAIMMVARWIEKYRTRKDSSD